MTWLLLLSLTVADTTRIPLSLAAAIRAGMAASADVLVAEASVRESAARKVQARSAILPSVSGNAGWVNRSFNIHTFGLEFPAGQFPDRVGPFSVLDARGQVTESLIDISSWNRIRAATAGEAVSEASRNVAAQKAGSTAGEAYLGAIRTRALVEAREADEKLAEELAGVAQAQLDAGVSAGIDVTRAQTQVATAQSELLLARDDEARAEMTLARALGLDPAQRFVLTDSIRADLAASEAPLERSAALALARDRRPELTVERQTVAQAGLEQSAIKAERLPRVNLEADYGLSGTTTANTIGTGQLAFAVTLPLFDGLRREGRVAEQGATIDAARARERDVELRLAEEVDRALLDITSAAAQERIAASRVSLAEEELRQARERFQGGVAGNIEVIDAQASLFRARDAVIEARYGGQAARLRLARATGVMETVR